METSRIGAIILAAGQGTRMKSARHKALHYVAGKPMIGHILDKLTALDVSRPVIVVGAAREQIKAALPGEVFALQDPPLGTGHAVAAAREAMSEFAGDVLIMFADTPLVRRQTLEAMVEALHTKGGDGQTPAVVVLSFRPEDPARYGRVITGADGSVERIVEFKDADEEERGVELCNSGVMAVEGDLLFDLIDRIDNNNVAGEYYLTDIVAIARGLGRRTTHIEGTEGEVMGVNSRAELAAAEAVVQAEMRRAAMDAGVTLQDPDSVWFSHDTRLGQDVTVGPNVYFGPGVTVADGATIHSCSHLAGATVGKGASVGPFARLRPGAVVGASAKVGNFVEVKKTVIEDGAKVSHLTYLGDARVGKGANIGAGTITCNYDGFNKHFTDIGEGAFIGSNTALVAPVKVGDGALVGAGSVISKDVEKDALAVTRSEQIEKPGWAARFRDKMRKDK